MDLSGGYKNFATLRAVTVWAGALGVIQSLLWIGLTITGILAHNCVIDYNDSNINYGSITMFTFYEIYFKGSCRPENYPTDLNFDLLKGISTTLDPTQLFIWICVYLGVTLLWLLSSVLLLTHIQSKNLQATMVILYIWIFITLGISGMDLAHGVAYGIDFNKFNTKAYNYNLADSQAGPVDANAVVLISAQIASMTMLIVALRGFVLWIINVGLLCYFFKETFVINDADKNIFPDFSHDDNSILTTRPAIDAYEETKYKTNPMIFTNQAYEPERPISSMHINLDPAERAARMSVDNLHDRRLRNLDNFEQYPAAKTTLPLARNEPIFPVPDYSPPMPRANNGQNAQLRNTRYQ